jgi:hypothetical protein
MDSESNCALANPSIKRNFDVTAYICFVCILHLPLHVQSYYVKLFSLKTNTVPLSQLQQIKKVKPLRSIVDYIRHAHTFLVKPDFTRVATNSRGAPFYCLVADCTWEFYWPWTRVWFRGRTQYPYHIYNRWKRSNLIVLITSSVCYRYEMHSVKCRRSCLS